MQASYEGFVLSDDLSRISKETIYQWLQEEAYWSKGRSREMIDRSIDHSFLYGVISSEGVTVGCARVVTDQATFAWVCDVFVDAAHRGSGIGTWMVGSVVEHWRERGVPRVLLATRDAHEVYSKIGFSPIEHPERFMNIDLRPKF
jgi:N-acetylglutamate synthase-like GNAT family acetyltransferase